MTLAPRLRSSNELQWNPVNTVTNGPKKFDCNNEVTLLTRVSLQENVWSFLPKKSGRGQGGRKAGFHSISDGVPVSINGCNITSLKSEVSSP